jgi:hypothetical protein
LSVAPTGTDKILANGSNSSTLKMEVTGCSEALSPTHHYMPEDQSSNTRIATVAALADPFTNTGAATDGLSVKPMVNVKLSLCLTI